MTIFMDEIVLSHQERYYYDDYEDIQLNQRYWQREYLKEKQLDKALKATNSKKYK